MTEVGMVPSAMAVAGAGALAFEVDRATHRVRGLCRVDSPNADERPSPTDVSLLVVHAMSLPPEQVGQAYNRDCIDAFFQNRLDPAAHPYFARIADITVSAHLVVFRDGSATQYVPFDRRAWHAGLSCFEGRERCNDFSIGIELEGSDSMPFTDAQYRTLAALARALQQAYPAITRARIVGHADIAPGRRTDPGPHFDWQRLHFEMEFGR